jgi:3-isopropylmalate/(R)-2-methylmalate dehydratase large subunit
MSSPPNLIGISPGKRVLFLTKDLELIRSQLYDGLNLNMNDLEVSDLLDDINTDMMTPAWVCFDHLPSEIAKNAYAGMMLNGKRVFDENALLNGGFEVIVSGQRKGTGSSRETAAQCERWGGVKIVIAASFAPIHERNNINLGQLMGDHKILKRLQNGEQIKLNDFISKYDSVTQEIIKSGGLFNFANKLKTGDLKLPLNQTNSRKMTMAEKIIAKNLVNSETQKFVKPGDAVIAKVNGGYSHEFTTAQVHEFLKNEYGEGYNLTEPKKFAVFEDHLLYATDVVKFQPFVKKIEKLRDLQIEFQKHTGVRDYSATDGISPGICHQVAREEFIDIGDFIQATDSHTCMGGVNNALAYGVGATEYASLIYSGFTFVKVPESIRFELIGKLNSGCTAKDVMLYILWNHARQELTLDRSIEFGGPGLTSFSMDERATLCNMATECSSKAGICEADEVTLEWLSERRDISYEDMKSRIINPDKGATYDGGIHQINLDEIKPMVAHPGDPDKGIPSDPTNGELIENIGDVEYYAQVCRKADECGMKVAEGVDFYIQYGSRAVKKVSEERGWTDIFEKVGVKLINPGCGACIGAGPGISINSEQVTVSAINRNYQGRSGPGRLYLASPLTVATSAFFGKITSYDPKLFK